MKKLINDPLSVAPLMRGGRETFSKPLIGCPSRNRTHYHRHHIDGYVVGAWNVRCHARSLDQRPAGNCSRGPDELSMLRIFDPRAHVSFEYFPWQYVSMNSLRGIRCLPFGS